MFLEQTWNGSKEVEPRRFVRFCWWWVAFLCPVPWLHDASFHWNLERNSQQKVQHEHLHTTAFSFGQSSGETLGRIRSSRCVPNRPNRATQRWTQYPFQKVGLRVRKICKCHLYLSSQTIRLVDCCSGLRCTPCQFQNTYSIIQLRTDHLEVRLRQVTWVKTKRLRAVLSAPDSPLPSVSHIAKSFSVCSSSIRRPNRYARIWEEWKTGTAADNQTPQWHVIKHEHDFPICACVWRAHMWEILYTQRGKLASTYNIDHALVFGVAATRKCIPPPIIFMIVSASLCLCVVSVSPFLSTSSPV